MLLILKKRWRDHKWHLKENKHHNSHLQASYNKHELNKFEFTIEVECSIDDLLNEENRIIEYYNAYNNKCGYNINNPKEIQRGVKCNIKTKEMLSKRMLGNNNPMYGKIGKQHPKFKYKLSKEKRKILLEFAKNRRGNKSNASKLNENDITKIRFLYKNEKTSQTKLAKMFNVTQVTISDIILKKSWSHV